MKWFRHAFLLISLGLAGCATLNQDDRVMLEQHHVSPALYNAMIQYDPISLNDIVELSQHKVPSRFIVHYLYTTHAAYQVSPGKISSLKRQGVSQEVIDYLLSAPVAYAPRSYYAPGAVYPYYYPYPYYSAPYYGFGYPSLIIGGGYWGGYYHGGGGCYSGGGYHGGYHH